ncbi:multidrug effflux MFS transporter [Listeria kieliensis]|uniref:Bcr/CflA family efflux transporter n=1 Tax=Listeria kieliensis TaxID=1621700 RepID=A0A3D8TU83_9LIST|nr:multidrug effflux MFS transporter [Listeria kieliensis]RDX02578.1 multidrug transporter CflA [Listeria kieliensis]
MKKTSKKNNNKISLPLLVCLVGFPQLSETIYTPSLTEIALKFGTSLNISQMTLSIYFLAFAIGVVFWGIGSDYFGRRKAMNFGISVYIVGSVLCLIANSIVLLFIGRFIQAFGASTGSVTTQTILRDSYMGTERHQMFAKISAVLAFSPALGPLIGGIITQFYGFRIVFFVLVVMGMILLYFSLKNLPETASDTQANLNLYSMFRIAKEMILDPHTVIFGLLIGLFNGIIFSYYSEAPGIFIDTFHFTQSQYGFMGCVVASATMIGAWLSSKSLKKRNAMQTIKEGLVVSFISTLFLVATVFIRLSTTSELILYILGIFCLLVGIGISLPNCLSLALIHFPKTAGTSGAFLSLGYYLIVSLCTFIIGIIHTGSLLIFPIFCAIILVIALIFVYSLKNKKAMNN